MTIYLTLIGALVVTHAMIRRLTSRRCFIIIIIIIIIWKTKIGTEVATSRMTRTPLSRSKGQRSRSPGRFTQRGLNA